MGYFIFGLAVGLLFCGFLPNDTMAQYHTGLMKLFGKAKDNIKEKTDKKD
jgi:hypothetical protein